MKLVIAGGRDVPLNIALDAIRKSFNTVGALVNVTEIVSGGASGVDSAAPVFAKEMNIKFTEFKADWGNLGRKAGPIRNEQMAHYGDKLLAIWDGQSRGTANMIGQMEKLNKMVHIYYLNGEPL